MPLFWRGAPVGSYWHIHDARLTGFTSHFPGQSPTVNRMVQHIAMGTTASPFISLTRSYAVALSYALFFSGTSVSSTNPAYVYEIEIDPPPPRGLTLLDPVKEISAVADPLGLCPYHHDGLPTFLLGVAHSRMKHYLSQHPPRPPVKGGTTINRPANLTDELTTLVRVLRDSEILAVGTIPRANIVQRHDVF